MIVRINDSIDAYWNESDYNFYLNADNLSLVIEFMTREIVHVGKSMNKIAMRLSDIHSVEVLDNNVVNPVSKLLNEIKDSLFNFELNSFEVHTDDAGFKKVVDVNDFPVSDLIDKIKEVEKLI